MAPCVMWEIHNSREETRETVCAVKVKSVKGCFVIAQRNRNEHSNLSALKNQSIITEDSIFPLIEFMHSRIKSDLSQAN
jgi:hypothetical protein